MDADQIAETMILEEPPSGEVDETKLFSADDKNNSKDVDDDASAFFDDDDEDSEDPTQIK